MSKQTSPTNNRWSIRKLFLVPLLLAVTAGVINNVVDYGVLSPQFRSLPTLEASLSCTTIPFLDSSKLTEAYSIDLEVNNTGQKSIERRSYEKPLTLIFTSETKILAVKLLATQPELLAPAYQIGIWNEHGFIPAKSGHAIQFQPLLLNEDDFFRYRLILDRPSPTPKLSGHIAGVHLINKFNDSCNQVASQG